MTKIWIYINGAQEGPYTLEELVDKPVDENTKVWFEGLDKWYPAGTLEQMRPLFDGTFTAQAAQKTAETDTVEAVEVSEKIEVSADAPVEPEKPVSKYAPGRRVKRSERPSEPCPPTHIGWTVFLTICCCSPIGLAGLVGSIFVSSYYNSGRLEAARKASDVTAWLIMAAFALGFLPLLFVSAIFG